MALLGSRLGSGLLSSLIAGPKVPGLSPAQEAEARKQALVNAGLQMIIGSGTPGAPGPFAAVAQGIATGRETGATARQAFVGQNAQDALNSGIAQVMQGGADPAQLKVLFLQAVATGNMEAAKAILDLAKQDQSAIIPAGAALVNRQTGESLYQQPASGGELPGDLRAVLWKAGVNPDQMTAEQRTAALAEYERIKRAGAMTVNLNPEGKTSQVLLDITSKQLGGIYDAAAQSEAKLSGINVLEGLLAAGTPTGMAESALLPLRQALVTLGLATPAQVAKAGQQELLQALANQQALMARTGSGGMNLLPGQMSDRDVALLKSTMVQLSNTVQGNRLLLAIQRVNAENAIALAEEADNYVRTNNGSMAGWLTHRREWAKAHPITFQDVLTTAQVSGSVVDRFNRALGSGRR